MENTTRITDLPENIQLQMPQQNNTPFPEGSSNNYIPINIHPNPYGNSQVNDTIGNGTINKSTISYPNNNNNQSIIYEDNGGGGRGRGSTRGSSEGMYSEHQYQRLPSKDIRLQQIDYTQDDEIKANYIPKPHNIRDYLAEHEYDDDEKIIAKHKRNKKRVRFADDIFIQLQTPLLLIIMFFIFQLSIINRILNKVSSHFVQLFKDDGNINIYGIISKSVLFGLSFFLITKFQDIF